MLFFLFQQYVRTLGDVLKQIVVSSYVKIIYTI